jgi:hypothetical protein
MSENTTDVSTEIDDDNAKIQAMIDADTETLGTKAETDEDDAAEVNASEVPEMDDLTPFQAAKVASLVLGRELAPQGFYTMAKSHSIASNYDEYQARGGRGKGLKVKFDGKAFATWLKNVQAGGGTVSIGGKVDYAALAAKF